jgi:preprotein translocase subunit YajC
MIRTVLVSLLPSIAFAQAEVGASVAGSSPYASMLPLLAIFFVFYFLLIKPQQKRMKEHQALIAAVKKGDEVVTGGGIIGKVTKAGEGAEIMIEIAKGVEVSVMRATIASVVDRTPKAAKEMKPAASKKGANKNDNKLPSKDSVANDN